MPWASLLALGILAIGNTPPDDRPPPRVAAYLPDYRMAAFAPEMARGATELIVFSAEPGADGTLDMKRLETAPWARFRDAKAREGVRLVLAVGGWGRSEHFAAVARSDEKRAKFAHSAVATCERLGLDGLDLDWEHPKDEAEGDDYARLVTDLRKASRPGTLTISVTVAAWQAMPKALFESVDWVQVMAYDHDGRHSTFEGAVSDVKRLIDRGVPRDKIVLGLPFYGRGIVDRKRSIGYADIVAKDHPAPEVDEVDGLSFNGPATIRKKTRYALDSGLGGVMFWELGQDVRGEASLLRAIRSEIDRR